MRWTEEQILRNGPPMTVGALRQRLSDFPDDAELSFYAPLGGADGNTQVKPWIHKSEDGRLCFVLSRLNG